MSHVLVSQFKWLSVLIWVATLFELGVTQNTYKSNSAPDCSSYNNHNRYDGEICGTDGITYANKRYLWCLNFRDDKDVATAHPGCCLPGEKHCHRNYIYSPVCGYDGNTWSNLQSLRCHNRVYNTTIRRNFTGSCDNISNINTDFCTKHGIGHSGFNPVCASNGFTYQNVDQVKCLRKNNHPDLRVLYDGGCSVHRVRAIFQNPERICAISTTRFEWNPVCGTDGKTYANPFLFVCSKEKQTRQRKKLYVAFHGECDSAAHKACIRAGIKFVQRDSGETIQPINTQKKDLVCGNNGITYNSIHHLHCRANRDKYLSFKHEGPCRGPNDNPCGSASGEKSIFPICANNNVSYISIEAMWCVNRENNGALFLRNDGPCLHTE